MRVTFPAMARTELEEALRDPNSSIARLRKLLAAELRRSAAELKLKRSGYEEPVTVALAEGLSAVLPVPVTPGAAPERGERLTAALIDALGEPLAGVHDGYLALHAAGEDPELVALVLDDAVAGIDRLRARALVVPAELLDVADLRPLPRAETGEGVPIAHDDPEPARRAARRILQRLNGMGKWGGYHTEFAHLGRGFHGNDAALALEVGEALLAAGLLTEKPSVGQRHVSLNSRRAGEIHRLIEEGEVPAGLKLP
jgi:hypothetical protein